MQDDQLLFAEEGEQDPIIDTSLLEAATHSEDEWIMNEIQFRSSQRGRNCDDYFSSSSSVSSLYEEEDIGSCCSFDDNNNDVTYTSCSPTNITILACSSPEIQALCISNEMAQSLPTLDLSAETPEKTTATSKSTSALPKLELSTTRSKSNGTTTLPTRGSSVSEEGDEDDDFGNDQQQLQNPYVYSLGLSPSGSLGQRPRVALTEQQFLFWQNQDASTAASTAASITDEEEGIEVFPQQQAETTRRQSRLLSTVSPNTSLVSKPLPLQRGMSAPLKSSTTSTRRHRRNTTTLLVSSFK